MGVLCYCAGSMESFRKIDSLSQLQSISALRCVGDKGPMGVSHGSTSVL